ncbi:MAG: nuclear transport factor 2 family protein [Pseudohaliea sp.]
MSATSSLEARLRRLEDRVAIEELIARYGLVMDDRDMDAMPGLFTEDVRILSRDGVMDARGREAAIELYRGRFTVLGPSNHFTHDRIICFGDDPDEATGTVLSHAEMQRKGEPMLAAIRYSDRYRREAGAWRFAERLFDFFYYVPTAEYLEALGPGLATRMRAYEEATGADIPEKLATWRAYYGGAPGGEGDAPGSS